MLTDHTAMELAGVLLGGTMSTQHVTRAVVTLALLSGLALLAGE